MAWSDKAKRVGYGAGVSGVASVLGIALLKYEARRARAAIGLPGEAPRTDGVYGSGERVPLRLLVLGDSLAAGLGVDEARQTLAGSVATRLAHERKQPVDLVNTARIGAETVDLPGQLDRGLASCPKPDVAMIVVGANDLTHGRHWSESLRELSGVIHRLRASGSQVVLATCPNLGTVQPIAPPLRQLAPATERPVRGSPARGGRRGRRARRPARRPSRPEVRGEPGPVLRAGPVPSVGGGIPARRRGDDPGRPGGRGRTTARRREGATGNATPCGPPLPRRTRTSDPQRQTGVPRTIAGRPRRGQVSASRASATRCRPRPSTRRRLESVAVRRVHVVRGGRCAKNGIAVMGAVRDLEVRDCELGWSGGLYALRDAGWGRSEIDRRVTRLDGEPGVLPARVNGADVPLSALCW